MKNSLRLFAALIVAVTVCGCGKRDAQMAGAPQVSAPQHTAAPSPAVTSTTVSDAAAAPKSRTGEAFLVLKDDSVLYLADLPVVCLTREFYGKFTGFQSDWKAADRAVPDMIESKPEVAMKLKETDARIAQKKKELLTVERDARPAVLEAFRVEEAKLAELVAARGKSDEAHAEYLRITMPANEAIEKDDADLTKLSEEGKELVETTVSELNRIIAADRITLTKLPSLEPERFFGVTDMTARSPDVDKIFDHLFVIRVAPETSREGWATYFVAQKISGAFKGTRGEPVARAAFAKWDELQARRIALDAEKNAHLQRRELKMVAWAQRRKVDATQIEKFLEDYAEACRAVEEQGRVVEELKAWGPSAVQRQKAEAQRLTDAINGELTSLAKERAAIVNAAVAAERIEVKKRFACQFRSVIESNALAKVSTGSRGTFVVPPDGAYVFAEKLRENGDYFVWLAPAASDAPEIKLSNSTAVPLAPASRELWMLEYRLE